MWQRYDQKIVAYFFGPHNMLTCVYWMYEYSYK